MDEMFLAKCFSSWPNLPQQNSDILSAPYFYTVVFLSLSFL